MKPAENCNIIIEITRQSIPPARLANMFAIGKAVYVIKNEYNPTLNTLFGPYRLRTGPRNRADKKPELIPTVAMMVPIWNGSMPRPPYSMGVEYTRGINADMPMSTNAKSP